MIELSFQSKKEHDEYCAEVARDLFTGRADDNHRQLVSLMRDAFPGDEGRDSIELPVPYGVYVYGSCGWSKDQIDEMFEVMLRKYCRERRKD